MAHRRIETTTSRTAEMTCMCRAASFLESDALYKSEDAVANKLLPSVMQLAFRSRTVRRLLVRTFMPKGIYEWVIARTKYIDGLVARVPAEGFRQVLLIGAGFDTRGIRLQEQLKGARVYELDAATTQGAKLQQYDRRNVAPPVNLVFVPINFETERMEDKLRQAGFCEGAKTLVIAEGLFQYLKPEAVDGTLRTVHKIVGAGSKIVFDYAHGEVLEGTGAVLGQREMLKGTKRFGESWQFGLKEGELEPWLDRLGYRLVERKSPQDLEKAYFQDASGRVVGRVNGTQSIAMAEKKG